MTTINSISGGKTSAYMLMHTPADVNIFALVCINSKKATPKDPFITQYMNEKIEETGTNYHGEFIASAESDKTLKCLIELEQYSGKKITIVRGESFDDIIAKAGCLPTWARRYCTTELKIRAIYSYTFLRYGIVSSNIGYRFDDASRWVKKDRYTFLENVVKGQQLKTRRRINFRRNGDSKLLVAIKNYPVKTIFHDTIINYWKGKIDFPKDSNCVGCHHKSKKRIKLNYAVEPDKIQWFIDQEQLKIKNKNRIATFHDDQIPYSEAIKMDFNQLELLGGYTSCDSGYCTD